MPKCGFTSRKHENAKICMSRLVRFSLYNQGRSQDFSKGGAEVMEAKALKKKNCL